MKKPEIEPRVYTILTTCPEIAALAGYLIRAGAGTILPGDGRGEKKLHTSDEQLIAWELAEALADPRPGEWETEIGKLVLEKNTNKMRELARQLHTKNPVCPFCRTSFRVRYRTTTGDYLCAWCKKSWKI